MEEREGAREAGGIKKKEPQNKPTFVEKKTPTDNFLNDCLRFSFSPPIQRWERREKGTNKKHILHWKLLLFPPHTPTHTPPNLAHHLRGGLRGERGPLNGRMTANLGTGDVEGWLYEGDQLGNVEWMFLFGIGGETLCLTVDCICLSLAWSLWADASMCPYVCVCVCERHRERGTDGGIYPSSFLQLQLSGLAVIHKATWHK